MTHPNSTNRSRRRRTEPAPEKPLRVELTNEEILADLLYPGRRDVIQATIGRRS